MALFISPSARTNATPIANRAGTVMVATFTFSFAKAFDASEDLLELGLLPAHATPVRATLIGEGVGTGRNATVGFMSGQSGFSDDTRTRTDTAFFSSQSVDDAEGAATALKMKAVTASQVDRGIGVTLNTDVTADAAKKITLVLEYTY